MVGGRVSAMTTTTTQNRWTVLARLVLSSRSRPSSHPDYCVIEYHYNGQGFENVFMDNYYYTIKICTEEKAEGSGHGAAEAVVVVAALTEKWEDKGIIIFYLSKHNLWAYRLSLITRMNDTRRGNTGYKPHGRPHPKIYTGYLQGKDDWKTTGNNHKVGLSSPNRTYNYFELTIKKILNIC